MPGPWSNSGVIDQTAIREGKQITSANASTYIANLAVDTLQIAGNAVTVPSSAFTSSQSILSFSGGGAQTVTIQSLTVSTSGAPILLMASAVCVLNATSGGGKYANVTLYEDGSLIQQIGGNVDDLDVGHTRLIASGFLKRTPAAGTHTYTIQLNGYAGNGESVSASDRSITILETKK